MFAPILQPLSQVASVILLVVVVARIGAMGQVCQ